MPAAWWTWETSIRTSGMRWRRPWVPRWGGNAVRLAINVAARPFLNRKPWILALTAILLACGVFTFVNVYLLSKAFRRHLAVGRALAQQAATLEAVREAAEQAEARLSPARRTAIRERAVDASAIVRQRSLSWTALFDHLEEVTPINVRILSILPDIVDNRVVLRMECQAKTNQDKLDFMERLYQPPFDNPYVISDEFESDGVRFHLKCSYDPAAAVTAEAESDEQPSEGS
jgi:hypothetical protein